MTAKDPIDMDSENSKSETDPAEGGTLPIKIEITKGQSWTRFLAIEVPASSVDDRFKKALEEYKSKAKIPGFRPGKVPMNIIEKKFSNEVGGEVLETLIGESYQQALIQNKLWPLGDPKVSDVKFDRSAPLQYKAEIEIRPELKLKKYKKFRIEKVVRKVKEKDVDDSIEYMREKMAEFETVERASMNGDLVIVDLLKKYDKLNKLKEDKLENVEIILGSEGVLKGFREGLPGMSIGEMKDISVKYPQDYADSNLAGNEITYTTVVKEIKKRNLPEVNNEFVMKVSPHKTVDEFRESLKKNIEKQAETETNRNLRSEAIKKVVEANSFDVPVSLLNKYLDSVVNDFKSNRENVDESSIRNQYREMGENLIRWNFLYYEIAKAEKITVTTDDRKKWVHDFALTHDLTEEKAREILGKSKRQQDIDDSIVEGKTLEFIIENSEIIISEK